MDHHIDRVCVVFAFHLVLNIEVFNILFLLKARLVYWMEIMTWMAIFIMRNKKDCNEIIKSIDKFGCEL